LILINPFKGLRPKIHIASKISTPSIGYLSDKLKKNFKLKRSLNFLNILFSKNFNRSKINFLKMKKKGLIFKDILNCYYIYKITFKKHRQIGIIGKTNLSNYNDKNILGHEETFESRVSEREKQIANLSTQIGPIFTTYKKNSNLKKTLNKIIKFKPTYSFKSFDKCKHELWVLNNEKKLKEIKRKLKTVKKLYICDGHHRVQAMLKIKKNLSVMIVAFPKDQIKILDYNPLVKSNLNNDEILSIIKKNFKVKELRKNYNPVKPKEFAMYLNKKWYWLKFIKKVRKLDVIILHNYIINRLLKNKKELNKKVKFISGIHGSKILEKNVNSKKFSLAFKLYPTKIDEVINVAEARGFMPPKSTWFHPKPLDGLISSEL
jgi:uncharacterized protein (DUF1015 family)